MAQGTGIVGGTGAHESTPSQGTEASRANVKVREEAIINACRRMYECDTEIAEIIEESDIPDLRQEKSDIKKSLRENFGITHEAIQARYYAFRLEQKAIGNNDDILLDTIREMFKALPVGASVDLARAAGDDTQEIADTLDQAKKKGTAAGAEGKNFDSNPYPEGSKHHTYWAQNWKVAQSKLAETLGKGDQPAATH